MNLRNAPAPLSSEPQALLSRLRAALPRMIADVENLVACESPSSDPAAIALSATRVADLGTFRLGDRPEVLEISGCVHLRWRFGSPQPASGVLVLCHHDTVWPLGSAARLPAGMHEGAIRGPGCLDMKAGIAMAFHALSALTDRRGVTLLVTGDEEIGSPTSRSLIEEEARDCTAVLVLEPAAAGGALKIARKGRARYEIEITGRAAHAGVEPEAGVNAAIEVAHQILAVSRLGDPAAGTSVTPTVVSGGTTVNTVPAAARLSIDVRAWTQAELDRVEAQVRSLRANVAGAQVLVAGGIDRRPLEPESSAWLFAHAQRVAATIGLDELRGVETGGGSDGNLTAGLGIPTLDGLGAVGEGLHADHEHVVAEELPRRTALLALLLESLLDSGPAPVADDTRTAA